MPLFHRVVIALGRTAADHELLAHARMLATLEPEAEFHCVHVLDWLSSPGSSSAVVTHDAALAAIRSIVEGELGEPSAACRVLHGTRVDRLLEFAAEARADLILVGHGPNRSGRRSLARRLAMSAPCSIWFAPQGPAPRLGRIAAAIDFSPHSALALSVATAIARRRGLDHCAALHVLPAGEAGRGQEPSLFARFIAPLNLQGVAVEPVSKQGSSVAAAVHEFARCDGVDLVVMGIRGRSPSASILLGSESEQVLMETRVPVLLVKQPGERLWLLQLLLDREFHPRSAPGAA